MSNDENREKNEEKAAVPVQPIIDMGSTVCLLYTSPSPRDA